LTSTSVEGFCYICWTYFRENSSVVWSPSAKEDIQKIKSVQVNLLKKLSGKARYAIKRKCGFKH